MTSNKRGRTIYFAKGMTADCVSDHAEWLDELQRRAESFDSMLAVLREAEATLSNAQERFSVSDTLKVVRIAIANATKK